MSFDAMLGSSELDTIIYDLESRDINHRLLVALHQEATFENQEQLCCGLMMLGQHNANNFTHDSTAINKILPNKPAAYAMTCLQKRAHFLANLIGDPKFIQRITHILEERFRITMIPERIDVLVRMKLPQGVGPSLIGQPAEGVAHLRAKQHRSTVLACRHRGRSA